MITEDSGFGPIKKPNTPLCPKCQLSSTQFNSITNELAPTRFTDENGKEHVHENKVVYGNFRCANEHTWLERVYQSCWCGWSQRAWTEKEVNDFKDARQKD